MPLQKPYPRVWIPGVISPETIIWAAQHGYPYIALNTPVERTKQIWEIYDDAAAEAGFQGGPDYHGLLEADPRRRDRGKGDRERRASSAGCRASSPASPIRCGATPAGYGSPATAARSSSSPRAASKNPRGRPALEKQMEELMIIAGTPKQVIAKLRILLEETRPGILGIWGNDGTVTHEDAKTCIRLLGQEVLPAVREMAKELDLKSPFETNQPVSVDYMPGRPNAAQDAVRAAAE